MDHLPCHTLWVPNPSDANQSQVEITLLVQVTKSRGLTGRGD